MKQVSTVSLLISTLSVLSQLKAQKIKIYGKVKDGDSLIGGATVTLRNSLDSLLVKGTAANDSGIYELNNIDTGNYEAIRRIATRYISIGLTYNFSSGKKQTGRENVEAAGSDARGRL